VEGVRPTDAGGAHTITGLEAGTWSIVATAIGFRTQTATVTIVDEGATDLQLNLEVSARVMPDLFGLDLNAALARLQSAGIPLTRLLDFEGTDYAPANPGREELTQPVLAQSPVAGALLDNAAASRGAAAVIAVPAQLESVVEVPSLAGLTQDEAKRVLENLGLRVGKVTVLQPRT
jgi:beta-lactam-binding protein with PASTA domain